MVKAGQVLFVPGAAKKFLYRLNTGQVELRRPIAATGQDEIETLQAGEYFSLGFLDFTCAAQSRTPMPRLSGCPEPARPISQKSSPTSKHVMALKYNANSRTAARP
jgi:hypothetical protein